MKRRQFYLAPASGEIFSMSGWIRFILITEFHVFRPNKPNAEESKLARRRFNYYKKNGFLKHYKGAVTWG